MLRRYWQQYITGQARFDYLAARDGWVKIASAPY